MDHILTYLRGLHLILDRLSLTSINAVIETLHEARIYQRQIFILGNGGSASTASHFACDLGKNTRLDGWPNFRVMGLTDNLALITAYANDEGYENVFAQQLANFVIPGDVVIGISASGNSANILKTILLAKENQATTIGFTGFDGGNLGPMVDINLHVKSNCIEYVEDIHLMLEHLICNALRENVRAIKTPSPEGFVMARKNLRQAYLGNPLTDVEPVEKRQGWGVRSSGVSNGSE